MDTVASEGDLWPVMETSDAREVCDSWSCRWKNYRVCKRKPLLCNWTKMLMLVCQKNPNSICMVALCTDGFFITHGVFHPPTWVFAISSWTICLFCNCRSLFSYLLRDTRMFHSSTCAFHTLIISHYQPNREPKLHRTCRREAKNKSVCLRAQKNQVKKKTGELASIMASTKLDRRKDTEIYGQLKD